MHSKWSRRRSRCKLALHRRPNSAHCRRFIAFPTRKSERHMTRMALIPTIVQQACLVHLLVRRVEAATCIRTKCQRKSSSICSSEAGWAGRACDSAGRRLVARESGLRVSADRKCDGSKVNQTIRTRRSNLLGYSYCRSFFSSHSVSSPNYLASFLLHPFQTPPSALSEQRSSTCIGRHTRI